MAWFRRSKDAEPTSLEQYYADQGRSGARSWLLALGAFILTLVLVFGVFWAGRWVYRKATHKDKATVATTKQAGDPYSSSTIKQPSNTTKNTTTTNNTSTTQNSGTQDTKTTTPSDNTSTSSTNSTQTNTTTTDNSKAITNTGPGENLALFTITTLAGVVIYQIKLRTRAF